ncbi:MAG: T9SS type A sorting domain-containing protein, partial [Bacteroidales bacterium]|nr:T9SS type A sorting domain-containing protein [Bacteroidales bacterium]
DWLTAENWENEQIPTSSDNVVIPATAVQWPTFSGNISLGTNCNNITLDGASQLTVTGDFTINSPRVLTINGAGTVNIGGTWLRYGNFSYGTGTINFYGNTDSNIDTYIGTTETFYNLTISKNLAKAKTLDDVNVLNDLTVNPNSWFTNNTGNTLNISADVFLKADNTGVFSFKDKGTTNIAGATYVEQYLTSERWHLVSPPVTGATINTYLAIYLKKYNEPTDTWTYLTEPTSTPMNTGQGYAAWASDNYTGTTTVSYTGTLNRNDLLLNTFDYTPAATNTGFNLIGNPFPCGIDWNSDPNWAMQDMSGWMVVYDNGIYKGQHTDGSDYNGKTDGHISPTQGFWVRATSSSAQLTIPTSERFHMDEPFYKDEQESKYPEIRLSCEIGSYVDETVVIFHPECSSGFDGYYDLAKFYNVSEAPQLYSITEGDNYAVNFQDPEYIKKIIPIGFTTANSGNYNLQVPSITKFDKNIFILLEDLKTGKTVNLKSFTTYNFDYSTDDNEHRFNLLFLKKNTSISNHKGSLSTHKESLTDDVDIYSYRNQVIVKTPSGSHGWIYVYDLLGEQIISNRINENGLTQIQIGRNTGFYLVKVNTGDYFTSKKVFIR